LVGKPEGKRPLLVSFGAKFHKITRQKCSYQKQIQIYNLALLPHTDDDTS
jgi:hypothetical protein